MKNVRLFAVAAALGMFASTVAAAETTTPTVKWSEENGTIIRVELNDKVLYPTLTANVTLNGESKVCQNGIDADNDGYVDGEVYAVNPEINEAQGWLYTDAKYWATNGIDTSTPLSRTAMYYLGLTNGSLSKSGRFLAPGSAEIEEDVFVSQLDHKWYESEEECYNALEEKGYISTVRDEDGDIKAVQVTYKENKYNGSSNIQSVDYVTVVSEGAKKSDAYITEAVVDFFVNGTDLKSNAGLYKVYSSNVPTVASGTRMPKIQYTFDGGKTSTQLVAANDGATYATLLSQGLVVVVDGNKKGYTAVGTAFGSQSYVTNSAFAGANRLTSVVDDTDIKDTIAKVTDLNSLASADKVTFSNAAGATLATVAVAAGAGTSPTTAGELVIASGKVATSDDLAAKLVTGIYDGTNVVSLDDTKVFKVTTDDGTNGKLDQEIYGIDEIEKDVTYLTADQRTEFTADQVEYATLALDGSSHNVKPVNDKYAVAVTNDLEQGINEKKGVLDAVAYVTVDDAGNKSINIAKWDETDIYYQVTDADALTSGDYDNGKNPFYGKSQNDLIKVTSSNYEKLFKLANLSQLYVGNAKLTNYTTSCGNVTSGYAGLIELEFSHVTYDYSGLAVNAYTKAGLNAANTYFIKNHYVEDSGATVDEAYDISTDKVYTAKKIVNPLYNQVSKYGTPGTIAIVDISNSDVSAEVRTKPTEYEGAELVARLAITTQKDYEQTQVYTIDIDDFDVTLKSSNASTPVERTSVNPVSGKTNTNGIVELKNIPENDTEYWVLLTNRAGLDLTSIWSYSSAKETGVLTAADGTEIPCKAVLLEKKGSWYPAFESEEELAKAVYAITGLDKALVGSKTDKTASTFKTWYASAAASLKQLKAADDKHYSDLADELPVSATSPKHGAEKCSYVVSEEAKGVTVTHTTVDTSKAGVYDVTYTASYNGEALAETATVKVVVAPKYVRTWENGRVKTLTSYYVSNPEAKYAEYVYDWSKKTATVTYYNEDGSVAETNTISL